MAFITYELQLKIESTVIYLVVRYTVHFSQWIAVIMDARQALGC